MKKGSSSEIDASPTNTRLFNRATQMASNNVLRKQRAALLLCHDQTFRLLRYRSPI
jgi:hypothetical protein